MKIPAPQELRAERKINVQAAVDANVELVTLLLAAYGPPVGESIEEWVKRRQREARRREGDR